MKRRQFLVGAGIATAAVASGSFIWLVRDPAPEVSAKPIVDALGTFAESLQGVSVIGRQYLLTDKTERADILVDRIAGNLDGVTHVSKVTPRELTAQIERAIVSDFESDRLCVIEGWQLSRTECQLAALHVLLVGGTKANSETAPEFGNAEEKHIVEIESWGPKETAFNVAFNVQQDGHSGMWFVPGEPPPRSLEAYLGGLKVPTTIRDDVITIGLYDEFRDKLITTPGDHPIYLYDKARNVKQKIGEFSVGERLEYTTLADGTRSEVFCPVQRWGPQHTKAGQSFNVQPDGDSAFWIRIDCAPHDTVVKLGGRQLATTVRADFVTASTPNPELLGPPGEYPLTLNHPGTGEVLQIGNFEIRPNQ